MKGRKVTQTQFQVLVEYFKQCPAPLYLQLIFRESLRWPSFLQPEDIRLATTVKKVAVNLFGRLEKEHSEPLVKRALGYLTAARNGVSENEMEDLLSLDDAVLDDLFVHFKPPLRHLPQVYWLRLRQDLEEYVEEAVADDTVTLRWFSHEFKEAATERYLDQRDKAPSYHKALAEYFSDAWRSTPKPSPKGKPELRHIIPQPMYRDHISSESGKTERVYNLRHLNELPYHLLNSQQMDALKKQCLCNFEFMLAKLSATSLRAFFEDVQMTMRVEPMDSDVCLLSDTLSLSAHVLNRDPKQLASQIVGRLHQIITSDVPVAPADPIKYPYLKPFFRHAKKASVPSLIPSGTCLTPPGGILFDLLFGHSEPITAVITTSDGLRAVTTSKDNTLKIWELRTGRVTKTITGVGANVFCIRLGAGNSMIVTSEVNCIRVWSLRTSTLLRCIDQYDDPATVTVASEPDLLVAFFDGCKKMRIWSLDKESIPQTAEQYIDDDVDSIHKDRSFLVSTNTHGVRVLYAFRSANTGFVRNAKNGKVVHRLQCSEGSITALATSREYYVIALRLQYMKLHEIYQLALFDLRNGQYVRVVRGCVNDNVKELHINQLGSHALAICSSEANNTSEIAVWNIATEDHKHLGKHSTVSDFGACVDMRFCLTASRNENSLRIWNLSTKLNQPAPKNQQQADGLERLVPMDSHPRYIIAKCLLGGPLFVRNIVKKRFSGAIVRSERGIVDTSDVMVVKDTNLVVLTDKGFSNISSDHRPIYQTVLVYDLLEKKFKQKITGCYIVPCQSHEYVILDDEHLMGLSETRNHFVVWSLVTGHAQYRIKTNFKGMDTSASEEDELGIRKGKEPLLMRKRNSTAKMTPWDRRSETRTARNRRHQAELEEETQRLEGLLKEKENNIEQFLMSRDLSTIVASYYSHHMCVFDVPSQTHTRTLENTYSLLLLHVAALTSNGSHVVHANYDDDVKTSYVTLWDCRTGSVKRRLRNEKNVSCIAIADKAERVVFGKTNKELRIWDPTTGSVKKIKGYTSLNFAVGSQIHITAGGSRCVVFTGDISMWDLEQGILLAVFTPDMKVQGFTLALDGQMIAFGLRDRSDVITLRLMGADTPKVERLGKDLFDEASDSSSDEDEEDEVERRGSEDSDE